MTHKKRTILVVGLLLSCLIQAESGLKTDIPHVKVKQQVPGKPAVAAQKGKTQKKTAALDDAKKVQKTKKEVPTKPQLKTVNKIAMIVYTDDAPIIITQLDLERRSLDGRKRTNQEVLLEYLLYHEALNVYHMPIPDDLVDKHIMSIKEAHGISESEISHLFEKEGYTFEEGKQQLRMSFVIQQLEHQLIIGRLMVTEDEIQKFHKAHPAKEPASFRIKKGIVSKEDMTQNELKALLEDGLYEERVEWGSPYWLDEDEIADSKRFITSMQPGQIQSIDAGDHYEIITLLKRKKERVKPLDERRREISDQIKMPKYRKLTKELHEKLLSKYEIVHQA